MQIYKKLGWLSLLFMLPVGLCLFMAFGHPIGKSLKTSTIADGGGDIYDELLKKAYKIYPDFAKWVGETRGASAELSQAERSIAAVENVRTRYYQAAEREAEEILDEPLRNSVLKKLQQNKAAFEEKLSMAKKQLLELQSLKQRLQDLEKALNVSYTLELLEKEVVFDLDAEKLAKLTEKMKELVARGEREYKK